MDPARSLPLIAGVAGLSALIAGLAASPALREALGIHGLQLPWKLLCILFALANYKSLPFVWHLRVFRPFIYHAFLRRAPVPPTALFQPVITSTFAPAWECDYNLHKSNSTYFTDLDGARTQLVTALLGTGLKVAAEEARLAKQQKQKQNGTTNPGTAAPGTAATIPPALTSGGGSYTVAVGGLVCLFKRPIPPYARYDIWTRLLTWDDKWLYIISHLVRKGVARPRAYLLQPGTASQRRAGRASARKEGEKEGDGDEGDEQARRERRLQKAVFATSLAKYVVKRDRVVTVPPEIVLRGCGFLPPRPAEGGAEGEGEGAEGVDAAAAEQQQEQHASPEQQQQNASPEQQLHDAVLPSSSSLLEGQGQGQEEPLDWATVERERRRGLALAGLFAGLDGLHAEFSPAVADGEVLGRFADLIW